jgi:hypothetical protein
MMEGGCKREGGWAGGARLELRGPSGDLREVVEEEEEKLRYRNDA